MRWILLICFLPLVGSCVEPAEFRPVSPYYISGDAFREYADHAYDVSTMIDVAKIKPRDTIFVSADYLKLFFKQIHPEISVPYILITHSADDSVPDQFSVFLDDEKLLAWFGENYDGTEHPKMHVLPMGTANFNWPNGNFDTIKKVIAKKQPKEHLLHMGLTIQTNYAERWPIFRQFSQIPWCYRTIKKMFEHYLTDVASSKFEICPRGVAFDTYRLWESLYVGTIPIVKTSPLDKLYEGLPVLIIQDWKEVTEQFLNDKYEEFSQKTFDTQKLSMEYWLQQIDWIKYEGSPPPRKPRKQHSPKIVAP